MFAIERITASNRELYADGAASLEEVYPEELRSDRADILEMFSMEGCVAYVALADGKVAGAVFGFPPDAEKISSYSLFDIARGGDIYLESITVGPSLQGQGAGLALIRAFADGAKAAGFRRIVGHFRKNGSLHLAKKLGGIEIRTEHDWFGTGEDFVCCITDLGKP